MQPVLSVQLSHCYLQKKEGDHIAGYKVYLGANGSNTNKIIKAKPSIAVIEMTEFTDGQIKKLRTKGIKLIAYLNVGAIEKTRPYYQKYKKYVIGSYSDWDEKWMDLSKKEWQDFLLSQAKKFKARGAMGLYIDNLDVVEEYKSKKLYAHARAILKRIRKETGLYLMVNGADYFVAKCIKDKAICFQAIQQEEVFTRITSISKNKAGSQSAAEKKRLKAYCTSVKKHGISVYLLEYRANAANLAKIAAYCKKYKMHYYNSKTVDLV